MPHAHTRHPCTPHRAVSLSSTVMTCHPSATSGNERPPRSTAQHCRSRRNNILPASCQQGCVPAPRLRVSLSVHMCLSAPPPTLLPSHWN
eukprot:1054741-Alexandrium_andersonii.AAC.1